jgi:hypothetical protein
MNWLLLFQVTGKLTGSLQMRWAKDSWWPALVVVELLDQATL